jgi:prepilin-type N-terminal cleavage/methylation domain-containing protein
MNTKTGIFTAVRSKAGVTMVELVVVLAIVTIVTAIVAIGQGFVSTDRIKSTTAELLGDLQWIRHAAMTRGPDSTAPQLRGFGIRLETKNQYSLFRFNDTNLNFVYDGTGEEAPLTSGESVPKRRLLHHSVALRIKSGVALVDPNNKVLIFDHLGNPKQANMGFQQLSMVIQNPDLSEMPKKCISISFNRIREGQWDGSSCQEQ